MMRKDLGYIRQQKDISEEKRMKKNVWIAGVTALLSAGLVWIAPVSTLADERIPDGVSVGAVSLSGLTEAEAEKQIESYVNEKLNQDITLVVNGTEAKSDAQTLGVAWDNRDEVAKAIAFLASDEASFLTGQVPKNVVPRWRMPLTRRSREKAENLRSLLQKKV